MTDERIIPDNAVHGVATYEILVDGTSVPPEYEVLSMMVQHEVNRIATATIVFRDGDLAQEKFELSEKPDFLPGKKVALKIGWDGDKKTLFQGIITRHTIRARQGGQSFLTVECRHAAVKMTLGRKSKYFVDQKDSDIIEALLGQNGVKGRVESTAAQHKEVVQYHVSDWDFVVSRAEMNGKLVFSEGNKIEVKKPDTNEKSVLTLVYGANLLEIEAEMDAASQWKSVKATAWDYKGQALATSDASSAAFAEPGNVTGATLAAAVGPDVLELRHSGQVLPPELQAWADATLLKSRMAKIRGRAKITGFPDVKPGVLVKLEGCGARFNGNIFITAVRHEWMGGSWLTHLQFGLSPEWFSRKPDIAEMPGAGLAPAIHGLQIGITVALENDPDGEDRIQVRLPVLDNQAKGVWARVCTLDAGNERGTFFRPEIGDEVIVGFLNDDPRDAIVLGMLNSSAKPAHIKATDDNHIKGWQTRSKMKLLFDDDKKIMRLETPAGNKLSLDEDDKSITLTDQHGNMLKMSQAGIEIKSIKDIKIEASANMAQKSGQSFAAEGGTSAELKAGTQLTAKGGASAEFSSGGATTLKGALVKIN